MRRESGRWRLLSNLMFVAAVLALAGFGMTQVAQRQWRTQRTFLVRGDFANIGGVEQGTRVRIQGIDAGVVESVQPPGAPGQLVRLTFRVDERLQTLVRSDATARIVTEGVVGAKIVEIVPGRSDAPPLDSSGVIAAEPPIELAALLRKASDSFERINAVAAAAEKGLGEINTIAATIRKGEGSLGKLVQDDEAYRKLVALSDRSERTLVDMDENLTALKRTWPLSRYFNDRSFFERDRILFHPGAERDRRVFPSEDLFEPGRAVLTSAGRKKLDEVAAWFQKIKRPNSEIVIAVFTDDRNEADIAQILTQEQADAVRKYLTTKHSIDSAGWFAARKVAAVGFGSEIPRTFVEDSASAPPRRVEVIVFTPQA